MASLPENIHAYSSELTVSSATLDRYGRRDDEGLTSAITEYMRRSGFVIRATEPTGLGAGPIEIKVSVGMIISALKAVGAAVRWVVDKVRKRQLAQLNTRLPMVWIQFSAKHVGGSLPLPDAGLLAGIAAVLPGLLEHLEDKFPNRQYMIGAVSNWHENPNDYRHSRRISFEMAGAHVTVGRLLRITQILEDDLYCSLIAVRIMKTRRWLPMRVKVEKVKSR